MELSLKRKLTVFTPPQPTGFPDTAREEEMSEARTIAYEEGYLAGRHEAEQEAKDTQAALEKTVSELADQLNHIVSEIEKSHQRSIRQILEKSLPKLANERAADEIIDVILKAAGTTLSGGLTVITNERLAEKLGGYFENVTLLPPVNMVPDPSYGDLAVSLSWQGGGGEVDIETAVSKCLQALQVDDKTENGDG